MDSWNFLVTKDLSGFDNMEKDLFLLDEFIKSDLSPILRFYSWKKPTISLGRSQDFSEINLEYCKNNNIDVVKRPTGGKAVFHQGEFTYSFISSKKYGMPEKIFDSYLKISKAIILGLQNLKKIDISIGEHETTKYYNSSFCFGSSSVSDLNYYGNKFVGSSQLRKGNALLQHGSILINQDFTLLDKIFFKKINIEEQINLADILGFKPTFEEIQIALLKGFSDFFEINFKKIY
ncbi:MAG: lipoate--protein ligase family protein [Cyanobacteriota bacterium]